MKRRRRTSKKRQEERKNFLIGGAAILGVLLVVFLLGKLGGTSSEDALPKDKIYNNVYIGDVDVSGMKADAAKKELEKKQEEYQKIKVNLVVDDVKAEVTLGDLGFHIDKLDETVKQALRYGKEGSSKNRRSIVKELETTKKVFALAYTVDEVAVENVISEKIPPLDGGAVDATITRKDGRFVITDDKKGVVIDTVESVRVMKKYFSGDWKKADGESITLATKVSEPKVTRAQLEEIKDVLGTFTTNCGVGGGRVQNIVTGAGHINGALILPGEVYSANAAMEPYTKDNGFTEAGSYENGKVVQSMGGGICQVSSTLYNAAILAELEIVERAAHSMLVSYVEPSMDAAIAGDFKDLKFKNNTNTPIFLEGYVSGGYITFNIYGKETRSATRTIKYVSEVLSSTPAGNKFQASGDPVGTLTKVSSGYTGMKAKLWKIVYENGVEVSREVVNNSSYRSSDAVWNVGTASDNAQAAAIVQGALGSNDKATIEAAIAQAKALIDAAKVPETPAPPTEGGTTPPVEEATPENVEPTP